jgi:hypothetical protein
LPDLLISVYRFPEGEETTFRFLFIGCANEKLRTRQKRATKKYLANIAFGFL